MKILLDHCTPRPLRHFLEGHDVKTASEQGWHTLKNGDLLNSDGPTRSQRERNHRRALAAVWSSTRKRLAIAVTRAPRPYIAALTPAMSW